MSVVVIIGHELNPLLGREVGAAVVLRVPDLLRKAELVGVAEIPAIVRSFSEPAGGVVDQLLDIGAVGSGGTAQEVHGGVIGAADDPEWCDDDIMGEVGRMVGLLHHVEQVGQIGQGLDGVVTVGPVDVDAVLRLEAFLGRVVRPEGYGFGPASPIVGADGDELAVGQWLVEFKAEICPGRLRYRDGIGQEWPDRGEQESDQEGA